jgi:hypothetical protein
MKKFKKKKLIYLKGTTKTRIDENGEIIDIETNETKLTKVNNEPPFVKLYIDTISVIANVSKSCGSVLLEFLPYMTYADDGNLINTTSYYKEKVAKKLNIKINRVDHILGELCKANVIKRQAYSLYLVNPKYIAKGSWKDIQKVKEIYINLETKEIKRVIKTNTGIKDQPADLRNGLEKFFNN